MQVRLAYGMGQARHDDEPVECEEDTSARLLTTDLRFERTQLLADALAMLVLARAPSGIQARDEHRRMPSSRICGESRSLWLPWRRDARAVVSW